MSYATKENVQTIVDDAITNRVQPMIDRAVKVDVKSMIDQSINTDVKNMIQTAITDISGVIQDLAIHIDDRFNLLEKQEIERDKDNAIRDEYIAKHDRWVHKIARETGIKIS